MSDPPVNTNDWQHRLALIVDMMREMSRQTDPQAMVRDYGERIRELMPIDRRISLSRRGLEWPHYRITRYSEWKEDINPWKQPERLPLLSGGLLAELIYADEPRLIQDLTVAPDDPAAEYLAGQRSLAAVPMFDRGVALNMVVVTNRQPHSFRAEELPERVWMANLFGRATQNLVLAEQLENAYRTVDRELQIVAGIQRSLLPAEFPRVPTMKLAASYQTSRQVGGDYYDFFPLPNDRWGILIADVSGHGTPAAVVMAITHSLAHTYPGEPSPPCQLLNFLNYHLSTRYAGDLGSFVTAFYGIYDATARTLTYCCAGHPPPRVKRCRTGQVVPLDRAGNVPLGVSADIAYHDHVERLLPGDRLLFFTDGITEASSPSGEMFGTERLDAILGACQVDAQEILRRILAAVERHTSGQPAADDRTLLVADIS